MAEIILEPTAQSKVIPLSIRLNDTDTSLVSQLVTNRQFSTADTDAWFGFTLEGLAATTGTFDLTLINLQDKSVFNHTDKAFSTNPFYYKLDSGTDELTNEIRHAGKWVGQLVVTLANGDSATRKFIFGIEGHILDGTVVQTILLEDYNALITDIEASKDELTQYNIDYASLIGTVTEQEAARLEAEELRVIADALRETKEGIRQATFEANEVIRDGVVDSAIEGEMISQTVATKLAEKEATYAPRLLSAEQQLAEASAHVKNTMSINVKYPPSPLVGAKGDGVTDDTAALTAIINYAITKLPINLYFPTGTYVYTSLPNLAYNGLCVNGDGSKATVLKCVSTLVNHNALTFDKFSGSTVAVNFAQGCNVTDIAIEGNTNTLNIIYVLGLARSTWRNIVVRKANPTSGSGFNFAGVQLCQFSDLYCSSNLDSDMTPKPYYGINFTAGTTGWGTPTGSTANVFTNCYFEGTPIGMQLTKCGSSTFIGGSPEANTVYGVYIEANQQENTFIGVGMESKNAIAEVYDKGRSTIIINCYTSKALILAGWGGKVLGGFHQTIELKSGALRYGLEGIQIGYLGGGLGYGGLIDNGSYTSYERLYDGTQSKYIFPTKAPSGISVGASPFVWKNEKQLADLLITGGTISAITYKRTHSGGTYTFNIPVSESRIMVSPSDEVTITYTVAPLVIYLPHDGFKG